MTFMTLRELRSSTAELNRAIEKDGTVVVTTHGKPTYVMLGVDEDNFEDTLIDLRRVRAKRAVARMRAASTRLGNDTMSMSDIDAEIAAARRER
jgi:antitoxin (DNA-binding transcriptional repressor) of toxin-antitoxin stability system